MHAKQTELKEYSKNTLNGLFGEEEENSTTTTTIPIEQIVRPQSQPRRYFDQDKLQSLADSIREVGLLEPIVVRKIGENKYELIAGERRLEAAKIAGLTEISINAIDCDERKAQKLRLIENLQREDLNAYEETISILELITQELDIDPDMVVKLLYDMNNEAKGNSNHNVMVSDGGRVIQDVFSQLGKVTWQSFVSNRLPLLKLPPDVQEILRAGKLEYTKANAIARIKDEEKRAEVLQKAIDEKWSLSEIKEAVESILSEIGDKGKQGTISSKEITSRLSKISALKKDKPVLEKIFQDEKMSKELDKLTQKLLKLIQSVQEV